MKKNNENLKAEFKSKVNHYLEEETIIVFGLPGNTFDEVCEMFQQDEKYFQAWMSWKFYKIPSLRMIALKAMGLGEDDYSDFVEFDKYERQRAHLRFESKEPDIKIDGQTIFEYKQRFHSVKKAIDSKPSVTVLEYAKKLKVGVVPIPDGSSLEKIKKGFYEMQKPKVQELKVKQAELINRTNKYEQLPEDQQIKYQGSYEKLMRDLAVVEEQIYYFSDKHLAAV